MRKLLMAALLLAVPSSAMSHNPSSFPGMFLFGGYMKTKSAQQCQAIMLTACQQQFGNNCQAKTYGQTYAVEMATDPNNFSLQCTRFEAIGATIYSVAGSAAFGHGNGLRDTIVRIKTFIDNAP